MPCVFVDFAGWFVWLFCLGFVGLFDFVCLVIDLFGACFDVMDFTCYMG